MSGVREREVERWLVEAARKRKCLCLKFTSPGMNGVPDRIVITPTGKVHFVEVKAPGKEPRPLQKRVFTLFAVHGCPVRIIDCHRAIAAFFSEVLP